MRRLLPALILLSCCATVWFVTRTRSRDAELAAPETGPTANRRVLAADALDPIGERPARTDPATPANDRTELEPPDVDPPDVPDEWLYEEIEEAWFDNEELLAQIGLPKDTPVALLIDRIGPPDPLDRGQASVHLALFDIDTGKPAESPVVLWRLDAPGNEYWTRGDKAVARVEVPKEGHRFTDLPAGEYRAVCLAEHHDAPDLPPFFVSGHGGASLFLTLPGERPVRAEVRGHGERLQRVQAQFAELSFSAVDNAPAWVKQRQMVDPPDFLYDEEFSTSDDSFYEDWPTIYAGLDGFDLGMLPENRRDRVFHRNVYFRLDDGTTERLRVWNQGPGDVLRFELAIPDD